MTQEPSAGAARDLGTRLGTRPSVHFLCTGAYLQTPVLLDDGVTFVPLDPLGFDTACQCVASYAQECGATVNVESFQKLCDQEQQANPVIAIVMPVEKWLGPEATELAELERSRRLRESLAWATGDDVTVFGIITLGAEPHESYFRAVPPSSRRRTRLGFGNTGDDFKQSLTAIFFAAAADEHFAFALSMLHDANKEANLRFKIARLFCCLESLAHRLKKKDRGSRDAVRLLLGLTKGRTGQTQLDGRTYDYDVVLGAGILRDHLFHGAPLDSSKAKPPERDTFDLLDHHPQRFVDDLLGRCELELARWSNGKSRGQQLVAS